MAPKFLMKLTQRLNPDLQILERPSSTSPTCTDTPSSIAKGKEKAVSPITTSKDPGTVTLIHDFGFKSSITTTAPASTPAAKGQATTRLPSPSPIVPAATPTTTGQVTTRLPSPSLIVPAATPATTGQVTTRLPSPSLIVPASSISSTSPSTAAPTTTTTAKAEEPAPIMSTTPSVRDSDKSKPYFPLAGQADDGYSNASEATATCFCGAVQLAFPVESPGLVSSFVCNCTDCRKITASMFASNFTVKDEYLKHLRGQENLKTYGQKKTVARGHNMTNYFCQTCGTLMYRVGTGFPNCSILRLGTVDDFNLVETKLKPSTELFIKDRVSWFKGVEGEGVERAESMT